MGLGVNGGPSLEQQVRTMPITDSESHEMMQIEMAAQGYVSGTLTEWPHLKHALRKRGIKMLDTATADEMRKVCQRYLSVQCSN